MLFVDKMYLMGIKTSYDDFILRIEEVVFQVCQSCWHLETDKFKAVVFESLNIIILFLLLAVFIQNTNIISTHHKLK